MDDDFGNVDDILGDAFRIKNSSDEEWLQPSTTTNVQISSSSASSLSSDENVNGGNTTSPPGAVASDSKSATGQQLFGSSSDEDIFAPRVRGMSGDLFLAPVGAGADENAVRTSAASSSTSRRPRDEDAGLDAAADLQTPPPAEAGAGEEDHAGDEEVEDIPPSSPEDRDPWLENDASSPEDARSLDLDGAHTTTSPRHAGGGASDLPIMAEDDCGAVENSTQAASSSGASAASSSSTEIHRLDTSDHERHLFSSDNPAPHHLPHAPADDHTEVDAEAFSTTAPTAFQPGDEAGADHVALDADDVTISKSVSAASTTAMVRVESAPIEIVVVEPPLSRVNTHASDIMATTPASTGDCDGLEQNDCAVALDETCSTREPAQVVDDPGAGSAASSSLPDNYDTQHVESVASAVEFNSRPPEVLPFSSSSSSSSSSAEVDTYPAPAAELEPRGQDAQTGDTGVPVPARSPFPASSPTVPPNIKQKGTSIYHQFYEEDDQYMANFRKDLRRDQLTVEEVFGDANNSIYKDAVTNAVLSSSSARSDFTAHLGAAIGQAQSQAAAAASGSGAANHASNRGSFVSGGAESSRPATPGRQFEGVNPAPGGYLTSPKILRYYNRLRDGQANDKLLGQLLAEGKKEPPKFVEQLAAARDHVGQTLLHLVADYESPNASKLIAWLVKEAAVPIDALDFQPPCSTALLRACRKKHVQTVKVLLDCGASFTKRDSLGCTPAIVCARENVRDALWILLNRDESVLYQTDAQFANAIHWACTKGQTSIVRYLADLKADFTHVDEQGNTALLRAIQAEELGIAQLLIERKLCSVYDRNTAGVDAFGMAASRGALVNKQFVEIYDFMLASAHKLEDDPERDHKDDAEDEEDAAKKINEMFIDQEEHSSKTSKEMTHDHNKEDTGGARMRGGGKRRYLKAKVSKIISLIRMPKKRVWAGQQLRVLRRKTGRALKSWAPPLTIAFCLALSCAFRSHLEAEQMAAVVAADSAAHLAPASSAGQKDGSPSPLDSDEIDLAAVRTELSTATSSSSYTAAPGEQRGSGVQPAAQPTISAVSWLLSVLVSRVLSATQLLMSGLFLLLLVKNPGTVPKAVDGRQALLRHFKQLDSNKLLAQDDAVVKQLRSFRYCETCHIEKHLRVKHCRVYDRCIEEFDHHCMWINNAVGKGTHRWFILFLLATILHCAVSLFVYMHASVSEVRLLLFQHVALKEEDYSTLLKGSSSQETGGAIVVPDEGGTPELNMAAAASAAASTTTSAATAGSFLWSSLSTFFSLAILVVAVLQHALFLVWVWKLWRRQASLIGQNLTLNESENKIRYDHFWVKKDVELGGKLEFVNPFDLGSRRANWMAFLRANRSVQAKAPKSMSRVL
ncbi:unnamed protein product [Amoebophrya sp. A120]|nr:unnamed protein product [Amoebophrya sp. A120]|eukprot:GSA120T00001744001.1